MHTRLVLNREIVIDCGWQSLRSLRVNNDSPVCRGPPDPGITIATGALPKLYVPVTIMNVLGREEIVKVCITVACEAVERASHISDREVTERCAIWRLFTEGG